MGPHHRSSRCGDRPARERRCGVGAVSVVTAAVFAVYVRVAVVDWFC